MEDGRRASMHSSKDTGRGEAGCGGKLDRVALLGGKWDKGSWQGRAFCVKGVVSTLLQQSLLLLGAVWPVGNEQRWWW